MTTPSPLLATLDALAKKAAPGPWRSAVSLTPLDETETGASVLTFTNPGLRIAHLSNMFFDQEQCEANAEFIAALVTAYPRLRAIIAAADELRTAIGHLHTRVSALDTDDNAGETLCLVRAYPTSRLSALCAAAIAAYDAARAGDGEKTT